MRLLLDTQVALWALTDSPRLSSAATIWEIAIKHALARADMPISGAEARRLLAEAGFEELPITSAHAAATAESGAGGDRGQFYEKDANAEIPLAAEAGAEYRALVAREPIAGDAGTDQFTSAYLWHK